VRACVTHITHACVTHIVCTKTCKGQCGCQPMLPASLQVGPVLHWCMMHAAHNTTDIEAGRVGTPTDMNRSGQES